MRSLRHLETFRITDKRIMAHWGWIGDDTCGAFQIPSCVDRAMMNVIASSGLDWDHVSVSRKNRTPNWPEMCQIKDLFFAPEDTVMQLHVPADDHINDHPNCLHLWRPLRAEIPRPPKFMVGGMSQTEANRAARLYEESL